MYEYKVIEVHSIYDGDTLKVTLDLGFGIYSKQTLRLHGINTPEIRGDERPAGLIARDYLRSKVYVAMSSNMNVTVRTIRDSKEK